MGDNSYQVGPPYCEIMQILHVYYQAMEDEMTARHTHLQSVLQVGNDLISAGNFGADKIQERIDEINEQWESLIDLAAFRKKRLNEAVDFYQVC